MNISGRNALDCDDIISSGANPQRHFVATDLDMKLTSGTPHATNFQRIFLLLILTISVASSTLGQTTPAPEKKVDRIVIVKSTRTMTLMKNGTVLKTYKVALSAHPIGGKERLGDDKTPEGLYTVDWKNAQSKFHLALHVSYPNATDKERARKLGVNPGGEIEIHGLGTGFGWLGALHRQTDWTAGCIAVTNEEIDEIWKLVAVGTPIEIRP